MATRKRLESALGIVLLLLRVPPELGLDVGRRDGRGRVDRLTFREIDDQAASGRAEAATGREVRNVLDDRSRADLEKEVVHVAARVAEVLAAGRRVFHRAKARAVLDQTLKFWKVHRSLYDTGVVEGCSFISKRHSFPPRASDSVCSCSPPIVSSITW